MSLTDPLAALSPEARARLAFRRRRGGKLCGSCGRTLPVSAFGRDVIASDGLRSSCRECVNAQQRARRSRA